MYSGYGVLNMTTETETCGAIDADPLRESVNGIFYDWWAENSHVLDNGLPGDVLVLRERLNKAFEDCRK